LSSLSYILCSVAFGLVAVFAGILIARMITS
jgi:hypothetical protein